MPLNLILGAIDNGPDLLVCILGVVAYLLNLTGALLLMILLFSFQFDNTLIMFQLFSDLVLYDLFMFKLKKCLLRRSVGFKLLFAHLKIKLLSVIVESRHFRYFPCCEVFEQFVSFHLEL